MAVVSLVQHCGIEEANLDIEVTNDCFHEISLSLSDWRLLDLLTDAEVGAIESSSHTEESKKKAFLNKWKQKLSSKATYRLLVDALLRIERKDDALKLCKLLKSKQSEYQY